MGRQHYRLTAYHIDLETAARRQKKKSRRTAALSTRPFEAAALIFRAAVSNGQKARNCSGYEKIHKEEFEQFIFSAMQEKFKDFQILHGREEKVNPKLTAYQVELAQVEAEIEKLLDTLTRPMRLCLPMATKKFEEPDTRRQTISKAIAELLYIMLNS